MIKYYNTKEEAAINKLKELVKIGKHERIFFNFTRAESFDNTKYYSLSVDELDEKHKKMLIGELIGDFERLPEDCKEKFIVYILGKND